MRNCADYSPEPPPRRTGPRRHTVVVAVAAPLIATAVFLSGTLPAKKHEPDAQDAPAQAASDENYDEIIQDAVTDQLAVPDASDWNTVVVKRGQSLSQIFDELHISPADWLAISKLKGDAESLTRLRPGDRISIRKEDGGFAELTYMLDSTHTLHVQRDGDALTAFTEAAQIEHRSAYALGVIRSSFFNAGRDAGLPDRLIMELADVLGYDIDFALELREGDHFAVVYDQLYKADGTKLADGDILAVEFVTQERAVRALRYEGRDGRAAYYTPDGESVRKAFIRTPLDVFRISSRFTLARWHPILHRMRAHKGTDYAAPIGTPVKATGDGRVEFVGRKGGYGNCVILRHGSQYETVYGHLSRFRKGLRVGQPVDQGEVIAYVGMTGLATGPHLHYEFRVHGMQQDPEKVPLPRANPVLRAELADFRASAAPLLVQLDTLSRTQVASMH